jgi:hypothetical protein
MKRSIETILGITALTGRLSNNPEYDPDGLREEAMIWLSEELMSIQKRGKYTISISVKKVI